MRHYACHKLITLYCLQSILIMTSALQQPSPFVKKYLSRLNLDPSSLDDGPTLRNLQTLQEAHLRHIPFENLAQHGAVGGPASLDMDVTAAKVLDRKRGGFCFELNGLFSLLLTELGYKVTITLADVHVGDRFAGYPTHITLVTKCNDGCTYLSDVGFGEPAIHPLEYNEFCFDKEQLTPEGMQSKFVKIDDTVVQQWYVKGEWKPRLQWSYKESTSEPTPDAKEMLSDLDDNIAAVQKPTDPKEILKGFGDRLAVVQHPGFSFDQKMIVTKLTLDEKVTVAGNKLKITSPRFPSKTASDVSITTKVLDSVQDVREALLEYHGIPLSESEGLDLSKSLQAPSEIWSQF